MIDEQRNLKQFLRTYISSVLNCKDHELMAQTMTHSLLLKQYKINMMKLHKPTTFQGNCAASNKRCLNLL